MFNFFLLLLISALPAEAADTLKGVVKCMNHEDCLGTNRECSFDGGHTTHQNASGDYEVSRPNLRMGKCVCKQGFVQLGSNFACQRERPPSPIMEVRETCQRDEDCRVGEICMTWQYDPSADNARKLHSGLAPMRGERHQLCIDSWVLKQHVMELDEPRTGGGLRSHRRDNFNADEYFFGGRRPPRVHQQYIGFAEDMMLILFLVCILATLVTVHRATCYRQFQEARRNTPLRHLIPIAEDRPPPYSHTRADDTVDGIPEVVCTGSLPKRVSETPPPSYEEALYRNSVRLPGLQTESQQSRAVDVTMEETSLPAASPLLLIPGDQIPPTTPTTTSTSNPSSPPDHTLPNQPQATFPSLEPATLAAEGVTVPAEETEKKEEEEELEEEETSSRSSTLATPTSVTNTTLVSPTTNVTKDSCTVVLGGSGGPVIPV